MWVKDASKWKTHLYCTVCLRYKTAMLLFRSTINFIDVHKWLTLSPGLHSQKTTNKRKTSTLQVGFQLITLITKHNYYRFNHSIVHKHFHNKPVRRGKLINCKEDRRQENTGWRVQWCAIGVKNHSSYDNSVVAFILFSFAGPCIWPETACCTRGTR